MTDDLREAMARAICKASGYDPDEECRHFRPGTEYEEDHPYPFWHDFLPKADAAIAVMVDVYEDEIERLREALRFYADFNRESHDFLIVHGSDKTDVIESVYNMGHRARIALKGGDDDR